MQSGAKLTQRGRPPPNVQNGMDRKIMEADPATSPTGKQQSYAPGRPIREKLLGSASDGLQSIKPSGQNPGPGGFFKIYGFNFDSAKQLISLYTNADAGNAEGGGEDGSAIGRQLNKPHLVWKESHGPHQVYLSIAIEQVRDVDTANESFYCSFRATQQWLVTERDDENIKMQAMKGSFDVNDVDEEKEVEPEWQPKVLVVPQALDGDVKFGPLGLDQLGRMLMWRRTTSFKGRISQPLDLRNFPFDVQELRIRMEWKESSSQMRLWPSNTEALLTISHEVDRTLTAFNICKSTVEFQFDEKKVLNRKFKMVTDKSPAVVASVMVSRNYKPYVFQVFMVMGLIALCQCISLMPDPATDSATRIATATTMFLTTVAFQYVVAGLLPKLSYLTLTDIYVLVSTAFVSCILGEVGLISWLATHWGVQIGIGHDRWLLAANVGFFAAFSAVFLLHVVLVAVPSERRKLKADQVAEHFEDYTLDYQGVVEATQNSFNYVDAFSYGNDIFEPKNRAPRARGGRVAPLPQGAARLQPGLFYTVGFRLDPAVMPFLNVVKPAGDGDALEAEAHAADANDTTSKDREYYRLYYTFDRTQAPPTEFLCCRKVTGSDEVAAGKMALRTRRARGAPLAAAVPVVGPRAREAEADFLVRKLPTAGSEDDTAAGDAVAGSADALYGWVPVRLSCPEPDLVVARFVVGKEVLGDSAAFVLHRQLIDDPAAVAAEEPRLDECLCFE